jgi:molecular chaperone DnaK
VTISESTNLDQQEIEQMVKEAEAHAEEDRRRREEIEARNELDSVAYRVEQLLGELQERLPVHEKARAEQLISEARKALEEQAGLDRVRPLTADLQQLLSSLPSSATAQGPTGGNGAGGDGGGGAQGEPETEEDVVDAEFTRE